MTSTYNKEYLENTKKEKENKLREELEKHLSAPRKFILMISGDEDDKLEKDSTFFTEGFSMQEIMHDLGFILANIVEEGKILGEPTKNEK